jgi:hypothetical protein
MAAFVVLYQHQRQALRVAARSPYRASPSRPSPNRWVHLGVIACLTAILIGGLFEYNLGDSEILTMFFVIVAGGYLATPEPQAGMHAVPGVPHLAPPQEPA